MAPQGAPPPPPPSSPAPPNKPYSSFYTTAYEVTATYYLPSDAPKSKAATTFQHPMQLIYWGPTYTQYAPGQTVNISYVAWLSKSGGAATPPTTPTISPTSSTSQYSTAQIDPTPPSATTSPSSSSTSVPKPNNVGLHAGVGVLAALLVFSLAGLCFLMFRRRRLEPSHLPTTQLGPPPELSGNLGAIGKHPSISVRRRPGPDDDSLTERAVLSRLDQLENSITTFALTYFQNIPSEVGAGNKDLVAMVPGYQALLRERRTGFLVVRAVVVRVLAEEGFGLRGGFLGEGWRGLMGVFGEKAMTEEFDNWRVQAISLLESSPTWLTERNQAIANLTTHISTILSPLVPPSPDLLTYLHQVVETASLLAIDLAKQRARYEVTMLDSVGEGGLLFDPKTTEDVWQESATEVGPGGTLVNELSGREVRAVVFPLVVKRSGERSTVISKAKVLV